MASVNVYTDPRRRDVTLVTVYVGGVAQTYAFGEAADARRFAAVAQTHADNGVPVAPPPRP